MLFILTLANVKIKEEKIKVDTKTFAVFNSITYVVSLTIIMTAHRKG